jgi:hypothetical protein
MIQNLYSYDNNGIEGKYHILKVCVLYLQTFERKQSTSSSNVRDHVSTFLVPS